MKTILLAALVLTTFLFAMAGCAADEDSTNQSLLGYAPDSDQFEREGLEQPQQPQATPSPQRVNFADAAFQVSQATGDTLGTDDFKVEPSIPSQDRIIVHTAYLSLVTDDVALTIGRVGDMASLLGGWVVNSERSSRHSGSVAVRVPAASLDDALQRMGEMAEVEARSITSQDVTDEYVDNQSRLASMRATEQRLLSFLEEAEDVEDALKVHAELSNLQIRIEETQGRLNFLSQTAAFSLIEVSLRLAPQTIDVNAGPDTSARVGQAVKFRASFFAPPDIDQYTYVWDFGDGSSVAGSATIPTQSGERLTATVTHSYQEDLDSEYIATITLEGTGEGGIAEGSDSLEVSVRRVPTISVFAGEDRTVEEGALTEYSASFTRPGELWDYQYQWDFGDGSPTVTGNPEEGSTRIDEGHAFADHRPFAYTAVLTVNAMSDAGQVSGSDSIDLRVTEAERFLVGGWDVGDTFKSAVRALSTLVRELVSLSIWLVVFLPVILLGVGALLLLRRFLNRLDPSIRRRQYVREIVEPPPEEPTERE